MYAALAPYDAALEVDEHDRACYCTAGDAVDPDCPSYEDRGTYRSVYTPRAKWGIVLGRRGFPVAVRPVAELLADPAAEVPAAMVTTDGGWRERCAASTEAWAAAVRALYEANYGALAVLVDLAI